MLCETSNAYECAYAHTHTRTHRDICRNIWSRCWLLLIFQYCAFNKFQEKKKRINFIYFHKNDNKWPACQHIFECWEWVDIFQRRSLSFQPHTKNFYNNLDENNVVFLITIRWKHLNAFNESGFFKL